MFHRGGPGKPKGFGFGGFQLGASKKAEIPPPPSFTSTSSFKTGPGLSKQGYATMNSIQHNAQDMPYGVPRKRPKTEEEYFEQDDEEEPRTGSSSLAYIPAPGSPAAQDNKDDSESASDDSDGEEDPLDAFMAGIEKQVKKDVLKSDRNERGVRDDIEMEDDEESYYRYMEENPNAGLQQDDSDNEMEYDEDGNPVAPTRSKYIDPLPFFDHSTHTYQSFEKNFYDEHEDISKLTAIEVDELRQALSLKVSGACPPKPVTSFGHFGFDEALMKSVRKSDYTQPTPIQAQGVPIAMNGRDLIGIAKTGSGKTAAFIWPMLIHIMDQKNLEPGEGPIGLILAPTRELALQIHTEAKRFGKVYNVRVVCCYGGGSKWEQTKALQDGAEIVVATPGRMIDLIKAKATNLHRVTFLVLDEADRMFDMGFEPQVRSICDHCRPDRQTLMFSATFRRKVERLARDALTDPVRVVQGETGEANEDVTQVVLLMKTPEIKWGWLTQRLVQFLTTGSVLIFVTKKANAEELCNNLKTKDFEALLLHGDMDQTDRSQVITAFRKKEVPIMVATDVAARGLDIPHIRTVVNYDVARDIDTHTHRVGRTGRAGEKGLAYTLVTEKDKEFAGHLVRNLEGANQPVPSELMDLAMQSGWFRKSRFKGGKGKKLIGKGLGFKERPGLGCIQGSTSSTQTMTSSPSDLARVGPQSDRITAMKAAFKAQYSQQFCQASSASMESTSTVTPDRFKPPAAPDNPRQPPSASDNPPVVKERDRTRKKSRWDS